MRQENNTGPLISHTADCTQSSLGDRSHREKVLAPDRGAPRLPKDAVPTHLPISSGLLDTLGPHNIPSAPLKEVVNVLTPLRTGIFGRVGPSWEEVESRIGTGVATEGQKSPPMLKLRPVGKRRERRCCWCASALLQATSFEDLKRPDPLKSAGSRFGPGDCDTRTLTPSRGC